MNQVMLLKVKDYLKLLHLMEVNINGLLQENLLSHKPKDHLKYLLEKVIIYKVWSARYNQFNKFLKGRPNHGNLASIPEIGGHTA